MQKTTMFCLSSLTHAILISLLFGNTVICAQVDSTPVANEKKKTVEPIFRVPKIGKNDSDRGLTPPPSTTDNLPTRAQPEATGQVPAQTSPVNKVFAPPAARVADARAATPREIAAPDKKIVDLVPKAELADPAANAHPLDRAVEMARSGLQNMQNNIADYTAILVRRERVGDVLGEPNYIKIKIRNARVIDEQNVPFSIYMKFLKPRGCAGREVIWVQGQNNGNLIAHETAPLLKFKNFHLDPDGFLAMKGNKYPIYDAGLENLVIKLIDKAERDRAAGDCKVRYLEGAKINKRPCNVIEVKHEKRKAPYEFHIAKVYIDDELNIPIRYISYDWPTPGSKPRIIEEYTYVNVKLNVGLSENDFSIGNPSYNFAK